MHIKIVGFKIHLEVEFIFKNGEMTLLRGSSGAGKSTILQAIFWALFGNMRGIYNNARITKNLSVYLSLPEITIFRKKNPELLSVTINNKNYEDVIAQTIIDNIFGNRELWKACSYIEQKSRCSLLSGSGSERMELLNALSFTGETPKEYINKISTMLKEKTNEFERDQSNFVFELNLYTKTLSERTINVLYTEEDILKITNQINELQTYVKNKNEEVLLQERLTGKLNYLKSNKEDIKNKINSLKIFTLEYPVLSSFNEEEITKPEVPEIKEIFLDEKEVISYKEYSNNKINYNREIKNYLEEISKEKEKERILLQAKKELEEIERQINSLKKWECNRTIKQEDIWNVNKFEIERNKNMEECKNIGLVYDENNIRNTINELTEQLKKYNIFESQIENYNKLLQIENKLLEYKNVENNLDHLEKLQKEKASIISEMKKGLELLSCPKCGTSLRYQNNGLILGDRDPVSKNEILKAESDFADLNEKIKKCREFLKLEENRNFLSKAIDKESIKEYLSVKTNKISSLSALINRISKIRYIPEIVESSETLREIYNYQNLLKRKEMLEREINGDKLNGDKLNGEKKEDEKKYNDLLLLLQKNEEKYMEEQKRISKNQELIRKQQETEAERLKILSKYEENKKKREERKLKIEAENNEKIRKYEEYKQKLEIIKREKISLENRMKEIDGEIDLLPINPNIVEEYRKLCIQLDEEKQKLDDAKYTVKTLKIGKELEQKREILIKLQNDVQALTNLKIKAIEVECKQLEDTVNNINTVLETTLPIFFNEPISLTLQLYKKLKTDIMKPGLNLEICYKGFKYDNINSLSGGEGDRISLALLLALNSVSNSPIILLDECVSSLDGDLKESCIIAIKSIPNKTVICIDHDDALEGFYDSVIDV